MTLSMLLMIIGIALTIFSFFLKDSSKRLEQDIEELSISIFQETNTLKRRIKVIEEELMLEPEFQVKSPNASVTKVQNMIRAAQQGQPKQEKTVAPQNSQKPIHEIIVSQVLELNKQGLSITDISTRSNLTEDQVRQVLATRGGR